MTKNRGLRTLYVKDQVVNALGFAANMVSVVNYLLSLWGQESGCRQYVYEKIWQLYLWTLQFKFPPSFI
jgi:hypothetical protein